MVPPITVQLTEAHMRVTQLKAIVRHIFEHNEEVRTKWAEEGMDSNDLEFLIELIDPTALKGLKDDAPWPMKGRPESHACLYEIVSNKRSGVDTDRMDYLKRDTLICKGNDFDVDYDRIFGKIKIQTCNKNGNRTLLTYEEGIGSDCMYILAHRDKNHREIYQHKKALAAEQQLAQALDLVKNIFCQKGSDNRWYTMAQSIFDMTAYCKFTEAYVRVNMSSPDERIEAIQSSHPATGGLEERNETIRKLVKAKEIMEDLEQGRIWQCVGVAKFATKDDATSFYLDREKYVKKICEEVTKLEALRAFPQVQVQPGHFHVSKGPNYNMGKKDADPLEYLPIHEDGVNGYSEGKGQSFYRPMTIGSEYCISFFIETEAYLNEAKKIFTRLLEEEKIKHDHISEDGGNRWCHHDEAPIRMLQHLNILVEKYKNGRLRIK